jgi:DNA-directed RNA polymerase subunit F
VTKFLDRNFNFNPDKHVRSAKSVVPADSDPERAAALAKIIETTKNIDTTAVDKKLSEDPERALKYLRDCAKITTNSTGEAMEELKKAIVTTAQLLQSVATIAPPETASAIEDAQLVMLKKYKRLADVKASLDKVAAPLIAADTLDAVRVQPPTDVLHHYNRYMSNHYEYLRDIVTAFYNEKSDTEFMVLLYSTHETAEDARQFRIQHDNEFRTSVITVENAGATLLGPFKENRERLDYYNKNTEVLKRMAEQLDADQKLGKDLMEKQVREKKRENIRTDGPDAPGLTAYGKAGNEVQQFGAKKVNTREDIAEMVAAESAGSSTKSTVTERVGFDDEYVPDDAIVVDAFVPVMGDDGEMTLEKKKIFTQAEAPLHMQEGSEFMETYQPKRAPGHTMQNSQVRKTITDRHGKKVEIATIAEKAIQK